MIGLIAVTAAGQAAAARLARAWPGETRVYDGPAAAALPRAWGECDALVCFLATGATVRLLAPLLASKHTDPAVVCVDEASRHAIALLGGHGSRAGTPPGGKRGHAARRDGDTSPAGARRPPHGSGGANALAVRVAEVLGAEPVLSTATDQAGLPGLDTLGWPVEGAVAAVSRAMLDGEPVRLDSDATWPLPAFPPNVRLTPGPGDDPGHEADGIMRSMGLTRTRWVAATTRVAPATRVRPATRTVPATDTGSSSLTDGSGDGRTVVLRPPSLAVGVGASRGVSAAEVLSLIDMVLDEAGLSPLSVAALATVDAKADEPGIIGSGGPARLAAGQLPGRGAGRGGRAEPQRRGPGRGGHPQRGRGGRADPRRRARGG